MKATDENSEWLVDSGYNKHTTPFKEDLRELTDSNVVCTFGNNETLMAEGVGHAEVYADNEEQGKVKITLNNVLHVPGLPQRVLSTGQLRRIGGEFIESNMRKSVLVMPDRKTTIPLQKKRDYLWLIVADTRTRKPN